MARGQPDYYAVMRIKGVQTLRYSRAGVLAKDTDEILCDHPHQDVILEIFNFSTNHSTYTRPSILAYKEDGTLGGEVTIINKDGSTEQPLRPVDLNVHKSEIFEELVYNTTNNWFKFGLKRAMRFANGVKILLRNLDLATDYNVACEVQITIQGWG